MTEEKQHGQTKSCPKCKESILREAKKCKHCGADLRNWFFKHKIITVIIILFVFGVIKTSLDENHKKLNSYTSGTIGAQEQRATANTLVEQPAKTEVVNKINETVTVGYFSYVVYKTEKKSTMGSQYYSKTANGIYDVVYMALRNNDKEFRYADSNMFKLIDSQGRSFTASTEAMTAYSMAGGSDYDLFLKQANPGLTIQGVLIFDIPKDATGLKLEVSGSFGSNETALIEL